MSNYLYTSRLQKRFDKEELVSISLVEFKLQNIPLQQGKQLNEGVVNFVISGYVSFDMFFRKEEHGLYCYEDNSGVFEVRILFDQISQIIENITVLKKDVGLKIDFIKDETEHFDRKILVDNVVTSAELRDVHPERLYSDDKLDEMIETYEDRVETASDWIDDYDTDSYTRSVMRSRLYEYNRCLYFLKTEKERRQK